MAPAPSRSLSPLAAAVLAAAWILPASAARAEYSVPASQAGVVKKDGDGNCSLWEAIDSINNGYVNPGPALHGCVNDFSGGNGISVEGNGTHYLSGGAEIKVP